MESPFSRKTSFLIFKSHRVNGKCEGKKIFNPHSRGLWAWKKIPNHSSQYCSDPSFSFQGLFCDFDHFENFALHGENWKMKILKNWPQHQIKWVTYCKWNFKCFKIWTNFKVWDQKMKLDFWKWKNAFFSQTVPPIEKITAPYEYKLLILHYRVPLFFHFDTRLSF